MNSNIPPGYECSGCGEVRHFCECPPWRGQRFAQDEEDYEPDDMTGN